MVYSSITLCVAPGTCNLDSVFCVVPGGPDAVHCVRSVCPLLDATGNSGSDGNLFQHQCKDSIYGYFLSQFSAKRRLLPKGYKILHFLSLIRFFQILEDYFKISSLNYSGNCS